MGYPNRNIGDAFLIVWKLDPEALNKEIELEYSRNNN